jgi:hypothetical protein
MNPNDHPDSIEAGVTESKPSAMGLDEPLIVDKEGGSTSSYEAVVDVGGLYLFGCFAMPSEDFAAITVFMQLFSIGSLLLSLYSDKTEDSMLTINIIAYSWYFMFICWVVVPMWQNYCVKDNETGAPLEFGSGFVCCRSASVLCGLLCGSSYSLMSREDAPGQLSRYLPFSLYNYWYMAANPGRRLNEDLPWNSMERFGFSRSLLLVISTNALGTLNSYIFVHAVSQLGNDQSGPVSTVSALVAAVTALIGYEVTLLSIVYGWLLIPYSIGMYVAFFVWDVFDCANPKRDTCIFSVLRSLWVRATANS